MKDTSCFIKVDIETNCITQPNHFKAFLLGRGGGIL